MGSVKDFWNKVKGAFGSRSPQEYTLECTHIYASTGTSVKISGLSIADLISIGGVEVQRIIVAIAHGLRLFDDYQYAICIGYRSIYDKLAPKEQFELQNELYNSKQVGMAVSAALIALSISPQSKDVTETLKQILYRLAIKALEIESEKIPHQDSPETETPAQLLKEVGITDESPIDIGQTTFRGKLVELSKDDPHLNRLLSSQNITG